MTRTNIIMTLLFVIIVIFLLLVSLCFKFDITSKLKYGGVILCLGLSCVYLLKKGKQK